jgi:hypothetical protein
MSENITIELPISSNRRTNLPTLNAMPSDPTDPKGGTKGGQSGQKQAPAGQPKPTN